MKFSSRELTQVALFASLISIASLFLKLGGDVVVPFSFLPFMVMLAGALLGPRLGATSVLVYVLIGLMGVPVFAKPPFGGLTYIFQPTFGFLPGFVLAAYVIGKMVKAGTPVTAPPGTASDHILKYMAAMAVGIVVIYLVGIPYLYGIIKFYLGKPFTLWKAIEIGLLPFIGLDLLKGLAAALLAKGILARLAKQGTPRFE